jgi:hypothetical protein
LEVCADSLLERCFNEEGCGARKKSEGAKTKTN